MGTDFRKVTEIVAKLTPQLGDKEVLVKNKYVGVNASDIMYTAGKYNPEVSPPFPSGFEGIGEIVAAGPKCRLKPGQYVAYTQYGAFADYAKVPEVVTLPVPECDPRFLSILINGLTASIPLEKHGELKTGETVLVTAAAGGTGQYAVQLAKLAGCHVIGTCSSDKKKEFLYSIGCDRAINYTKEDMDHVLAEEYPRGVDVVYESVGALQFKVALKHIAKFGRFILIGQISSYQGHQVSDELSAASVAMQLLTKSCRMTGFVLFHYFSEVKRHAPMLAELITDGKIKIAVDKGVGVSTGPFVGLEKVVDAVEYLYTRSNIGKVVVELSSGNVSRL